MKLVIFYTAFVLFLYIIWNLSLRKCVSVTHIKKMRNGSVRHLFTHMHSRHVLETMWWHFLRNAQLDITLKHTQKKNPLSCLHLATESEVTVTSLWMLNQRHSAWLGMLMQTRCNLGGLDVLLMLCWLACCRYITVYTVYICFYMDIQNIGNIQTTGYAVKTLSCVMQ